jgi:hypothetical protein
MSGVLFVRTAAGRIHKAVKVDGARFVNEQCNLDDAPGTEEEITFVDLERADPGSLCQHCWPPVKPDAEQDE